MGNEAFRAAFINENGSPKWISVTVTGAPTSEGQLSIESIRK
jgi:hypothetical protein